MFVVAEHATMEVSSDWSSFGICVGVGRRYWHPDRIVELWWWCRRWPMSGDLRECDFWLDPCRHFKVPNSLPVSTTLIAEFSQFVASGSRHVGIAPHNIRNCKICNC